MIKDKNILCGEDNFFIPSHLNFGKFMLGCLRRGGRKVALINGDSGEEMRYEELLAQVVKCASWLEASGAGRDTVAVMSENRAEFVVAALAVFCSGAVLTTLNPEYSTVELRHTLGISKPKFIFCSSSALKTHKDLISQTKSINKVIQFGGDSTEHGSCIKFEQLIAKDVRLEDYEPAEVNGAVDHQLLLYSSGTTGMPKGILHTHINRIYPACDKRQAIEEGLERVLGITTWSHGYGLMAYLLTLSSGATLVYLPKYSRTLYLQTIEKYQIQFLYAVPTLVVFLGKSPLVDQYNLSSLKHITCWTAPLTIDIIQILQKRLKNVCVCQGYGMSECIVAVDGSPPRLGSVGRPVAGLKIKVVDPEGKSLGAFKHGEIRVKSKAMLTGYHNSAASLDEELDGDGFLKTGDIGYYDNDGYLFLVDRIKELIKYKGYHVAPAEIEAVLLCHPDVEECCVTGKPDEEAGELSTAFVVKRPGATSNENDLQNFVANQLSRPKWLHGGVIFVEEIPRNSTEKPLRRLLKEKYLLKKPTSKI